MAGERLRLGVNIDHVATVRNARGSAWPDPLRAALLAEAAGADGITAHLREDRRHIRDEDVVRMKAEIQAPLNFEAAVTDEMIAMCWKHKNVFIGADAHAPKHWPASFVRYINSYGQDKVMFGTDFPVLGFGRMRAEVEALGLRDDVLDVEGVDLVAEQVDPHGRA